MAYNRVNWKDYPEETTPINAENLNKMDKGIKDVESSVTTLSQTVTEISGRSSNALQLASSSPGAGSIAFGVDASGNYGYFKAGADTVTPFKNASGTIAIDSNGTHDVEGYKYANVQAKGTMTVTVPLWFYEGSYQGKVEIKFYIKYEGKTIKSIRVTQACNFTGHGTDCQSADPSASIS